MNLTLTKRQVFAFYTVFLSILFNSIDIPATQSGKAPIETSANTTYFLGLPNDMGPTVVKAAFKLNNIDEIDDEAETFHFTGLLTLIWQDKRQSFDPEKAGVSEKIFQGNYQFNELSPAWYPQVVLANEASMYEKQGVLLRVQPNGTCILVETVNAVAKDKFDMRRYPFDTQQLNAVFQILGFSSSEVVLEAAPIPKDSSCSKVRLSQWKLTKLGNSTGKQNSSSIFTLTIDVQRKSFFILRLVVIPLALIVMLSWSVFWMDRSSLGDRINISFVGILTAVAYQIVIGGLLPHISYVTLMNGFVNLSLFIMCATVVINLVVGAYDNKGKQVIGDRIDYYCRWIFPVVYFGTLTIFVGVAFIFF